MPRFLFQWKGMDTKMYVFIEYFLILLNFIMILQMCHLLKRATDVYTKIKQPSDKIHTPLCSVISHLDESAAVP